MTAHYRALCCGCGNLRTIAQNYYGRRDTHDPSWRNTRTLRCTVCKSLTVHGVISDGAPWADRDEVDQLEDGPRFESSAACLAYLEDMGVDVRTQDVDPVDGDDTFVAQVSQFFDTQRWLVTYNALMPEEHLLPTLEEVVRLLKQPDEKQWWVFGVGTADASRGTAWAIDEASMTTAVAGAVDRLLDSEAWG